MCVCLCTSVVCARVGIWLFLVFFVPDFTTLFKLCHLEVWKNDHVDTRITIHFRSELKWTVKLGVFTSEKGQEFFSFIGGSYLCWCCFINCQILGVLTSFVSDEHGYCCFLTYVRSPQRKIFCFVEVLPLDTHESFCREKDS